MLKINKHKIAESKQTTNANPNRYKLNTESGSGNRTPIKIIVGAVCLALSVLIGIYLGTGNAFSMILSLLCLFLAIGFFTAEIFARTRNDYEGQLAVDMADETYFEDAEVIPVFSTEKMFRSAIDANKVSSQTTNPEVANSSVFSLEKELDFPDVIKEFVIFAEERGCAMDANTAKSLFASLASSRIIITREMPKENFELLVSVISEYFGTQAFIDQVDSNYTDENSLLFESGDKNQKKPAMLTIEAAQAQTQKLHFVALTNVIASNITNYFLPFINYANAPQATHFLSVTADGVTDKYYLPQNLWAILNLAESESVTSLPEALLEVCSVKDISVSICSKTESHTQVRMIGYSQMQLLIEKSKCTITEVEWKKLDAFVDFLNKYLPFTISNKQWIGMERYIAVLNECGENAMVALDEGISARIIPQLLAKDSKAKKKVDIIAGLNTSFEGNEISISRKAVKLFGKFDLGR